MLLGRVFAPFWSENGYKFCPFWSGIGYGFRGNLGGGGGGGEISKKEIEMCEN